MRRWMWIWFLAGSVVLAQEPVAKKPITLDVVLSGKLGSGFVGKKGGTRPGVRGWSEDGQSFVSMEKGKTVLVNVKDGSITPMPSQGEFAKSLKSIPNINDDEIQGFTSLPQAGLSADKKSAHINHKGLYYLTYADGSPAKAFPKLGDVRHLTFSPDGQHAAYVHAGNLWTASAGEAEPIAHTTDGGTKDILNGTADWVYEEEIFNRNAQAFWWSPDSTRIAFMRFDDARVPKFPITGMLKTGADVETLNYPKAGDANPFVTIGVTEVKSAKPTFLNLGADVKPENLVVSRVGWLKTPTGSVPLAYLQNRIQTYLDVTIWPDVNGEPLRLFRDKTEAWVEDLGEPKSLKDGSFLLQSERTGYKHIYHFKPTGELIKAITSGEWEARSILRVDEEMGYVYFMGTKDGSNRENLYRARLDGSAIELLTPGEFTHTVNLAPKGPYFVSTYSNLTTPPRTAVFAAGQADALRELSTNTPSPEVEKYTFGKVERVQVPMKDGFVCEGILTYPPNFDPAKKYPLWLLTYAGPHTPTVRDSWSLKVNEQMLANAGIVVFNFDPRPASGKGAKSAWTAYKQLGVQELKDLEEAVGWVKAKGWLDEKRVGIQGHSFGGYITAYALTHSKVFSAGISGAPVTEWRLYDSIYTERYMDIPANNKEGYAKSSVVTAAANLHGKLLLIHGMVDDNVHLQNSAQLIQALQKANKDFEVMMYPSSRHGIAGGPHYQRLMAYFIFKTMGATPPK
ncbi:MAG: DPP IV N-terminal domain-containing protein [Fimbriiglobus sp.]